MTMETRDQDKQRVIEELLANTRFADLDYEVKDRADGPYFVVHLGEPSERFFGIVNAVNEALKDSNVFKDRVTLTRRPKVPDSRLASPEVRLLRTVLSESLTVDRYSFEDDFGKRYIRSVFGAEDDIVALGNHVVCGRRGSGKSSLLAYRLHQVRKQNEPFAWIAMQTYSGRSEHSVIADVFIELLTQLEEFVGGTGTLTGLAAGLELLLDRPEEVEATIDRMVPRIRRALQVLGQRFGSTTIFLDDYHVLGADLQPLLLSKLYSVCRGNRIYLKLSGIEQFMRLWDPSSRIGMESPHDVQVIRLDYNLTMPKKSLDHITSILDAHARFCGLPGVHYLTGRGVLDRLVGVAAGVPRDALNLFAQAISRSSVKDQKRVSIISVNAASSEMAEEKLRSIHTDASESVEEVKAVLERVRTFCVQQHKTNAFLVEITNDDPTYKTVEKLIALRLLHVLHEGITPREAGRRFKALMLDYGFYVGIRAARSVELFQRAPRPLQAKELRSLESFPLQQQTVGLCNE